jgi:hypothetical protein
MYMIIGWVVNPRNPFLEVRPPMPGLEILLDWRAADSDHYFSFPLSSEGLSICEEFRRTRWTERKITDGVFADWLEEHKEELLVGASGPSDPAQRLDQLIEYLRNKFMNS